MQLLVNSQGTVIPDDVMRAMNPLVSFPANLSNADVQPFGYNLVVQTPAPTSSAFYTYTSGATEVNGVWTQTWTSVPIDLATAQQIQSQSIDTACQTAIVSGFSSSALGAAYTYPSNTIDQQNLAASVLASLLPNVNASTWTTPFWCADANGNWAWVNHTAAQIQQVGQDGKAAVLACQSQNATLQAQIKAALNVDAVAAIVWTTPTNG